MTKLLKLLLLAALLLGPLAAHADEGDWYVAPSIGYFDDDGDRLLDDSFGIWQIQFGREMSKHFFLEGVVGYNDIDGYPGQEHLEIGVSAIRRFRPESLFAPYVLGGVGFLQADVGLPDFGGLPPADSTESSATASAAVGLLVQFDNSPWSIRTEWRFRHAFGDEGLTDQLAMVGVQYSFGGKSRASAPVVASVPEPISYADSEEDEVIEVVETIEFGNIYFGFDSDVVLPTARRMLDGAVSVMKANPDMQVEVAGFADARGSERYNMELSQRRADAVRAHLVQAGVNAGNLTARGYGNTRSVASGLNANSLAENRSVELRITN